MNLLGVFLFSTNKDNTNKIFVNGLEDARNRYVPAGGSAMFLDNDKPLLYDKTVDSKGQFEVKIFDISEHKDHSDLKPDSSIDLSRYVLKSDLEPLESEIRHIKDMMNKNQLIGSYLMQKCSVEHKGKKSEKNRSFFKIWY